MQIVKLVPESILQLPTRMNFTIDMCICSFSRPRSSRSCSEYTWDQIYMSVVKLVPEVVKLVPETGRKWFLKLGACFL